MKQPVNPTMSSFESRRNEVRRRGHAAKMRRKPLSVRLMSLLALCLPGDRLKTHFYLNVIDRPRKLLRTYVQSFYRIDHIYQVLRFARQNLDDRFSILEFGTANGYAFTKMLYATEYLGLSDRVVCHAFDTFDGMPEVEDTRDHDLIAGHHWQEGQFAGDYEALDAFCQAHYCNYQLHKGAFEETLTPEFLESLRTDKPLLIWIDCDYYSSTRAALVPLLPYLPNGCVIYFDDFELLNYGSRFTGEARFVHELNRGDYGDDLEFVLDKQLSLDTSRCYRFIRFRSGVQYKQRGAGLSGNTARMRTNDSPLP